MKDWKPYIGQEVVCIKQHVSGIPIKDEIYTVNSIYTCRNCGAKYIDFGMPHGHSLSTIKATCSKCFHVELCPNMLNDIISISYFAPIERTKTQYVIKEVEVAPAIREMEVQLS